MKYALSTFLVLMMTISSSFALTSPYEKERQQGIDLYLESDSLDYLPPAWFKPVALESAPENISHWLNVLPYGQDKNADIYLVIPQLGLVTPVVGIPEGTSDYRLMKAGNQIEVNKYLKGGIIEYVGSTQPGALGKRIDFGHSNYYKSDDGRYKNIFANLMALDPNDQVWYFVKQSDNSYKLFKYRVEQSYNTHPSNVAAMKWDGNGSDALIFGCTHGLDGRWMIHATYMGDVQETVTVPVQNDKFSKVSTLTKSKINNAIAKIKRTPTNHKKYTIIRFFKALDALKERITDPDKLLIIDYIETQLAEIYPE